MFDYIAHTTQGSINGRELLMKDCLINFSVLYEVIQRFSSRFTETEDASSHDGTGITRSLTILDIHGIGRTFSF